MGCDIHITLEKRVNEKWVMVNRLDHRDQSSLRNYNRFAALAGVRGDGGKPKGVPSDISESSKFYIDDYGVDGHSHSYMSIGEAVKIFDETDFKKSDYSQEYPYSNYFGIDDDPVDPENYRIIFFFDN